MRSVAKQAIAPGFSFLLALFILVAFNIVFQSPPQESFPEEWLTTKYEDEGDDYYFATETDDEMASVIPVDEAPLAVDTEAKNTETPWLEYRIRRGDRMDKILKAVGASAQAQEFFLAQKLKSYRRLRVGGFIQFRHDEDNRLSQLRYKTSPDYYLSAKRDDGQWTIKEAPPVKSTATIHQGGRIDSSLFAAADKAGVPDPAIEQLIRALEWHVDFYRDVRKGDTFRLIYDQEQDEDGQLLATPFIRAYEYINRRNGGDVIMQGLWNTKKEGFYSPKGESMQGAFLRAPLKFRRISSRFSKRRYHPILRRWRSHKGVDYAARSGTSVRSTAEGVISLVARQRGYGKVVMIKHFKIYKTVYGHLSRFAKGVKKGGRVKQGQVIGYVGQTGLATGPHLHYEFRVHNKHKNPLSTSVPRQLPSLNQQELTRFKQASANLYDKLQAIPIP